MFVLGHPLAADENRFCHAPLDGGIVNESHSSLSSRGVNEQGCVGFAYDYGEYPKIVAVHSGINNEDSIPIDERQQLKGRQFHGYQQSKESHGKRMDVRGPQFSDAPRHSMDDRFSNYQSTLGYENFLRYQKEMHARGFAIKEFSSSPQNTVQQMSLGYQNGRLENSPYLSSPHIQQFQPTHHNGYFANRFQAPPILGVHPSMLMPRVMLDPGHVLSKNGQIGPFCEPSPSVNVKNLLYSRISSKNAGHAANPSSTYVSRDYSAGSRKRNYYQMDHGNVTNKHTVDGLRQLIPPGIMLNRSTIARPHLANTTDETGMTRLHEARYIQTRAPYVNNHLSCNDIVDSAIYSAKRYAVDSARIVNNNEGDYTVIEGTKNSNNEKTELKIPNQWKSDTFFQQILLHENRYDLLQTLKVAASSGRQVLLHVLKRLLSKKVIENSLILLDNIKRSDLPNSVKEKVLSVIEEMLWGHSPRYDLWLKKTVQTMEGIANEKDTRILIIEDDENLGDDHCKGKVLEDHLETSRKDTGLLLGSDGEDNSGNDCERVSLHENPAQKSERGSCEKDLGGLHSKRDEAQRPSMNNCQSEDMNENKQCPEFDVKASNHSQSDERGKCSSDTFCRNSENCSDIEHSSSEDINQNVVGDYELKKSTKDEAFHEDEIKNDIIVSAYKTRDQCVQVENLNDFKAKESKFNDCEGIFTETNESISDADSLKNCYTIDEAFGLENKDLELLGEVSIIVDSQGNTIIKEEIEDRESLEDGITIKGLNLWGHWAVLRSSDGNLLINKEETNEKSIQSRE